MNLDQTTVSLQPRKAFGCLDVGVRFYGTHIKRMLEIWVNVALPCSVLIYILTVRAEMDVRLTLVVLYGATWVTGVLTVAGASRALFGEPFVPASPTENKLDFTRLLLILGDVSAGLVGLVVLADVASDMFGADFVHGPVEVTWYSLLFGLLVFRLVVVLILRARVTAGFWLAFWSSGLRRVVIVIGPLLLLFPMGQGGAMAGLIMLGIVLTVISIIVALRTSFLPESKFLASLDEQLHGQGIRELLKREGGDLFLRGIVILGFCFVLGIVMFLTVDKGCELLLGYPILVGRIQHLVPPGSNPFEAFFKSIPYLFQLFIRDPRCLTVFAASVLFVYPVARLAWFFCYIDLRVRRDCWDMELLFQQEARRLEGTT